MDLLLLGAMAIVLIALTVWLVWHPSSESARPDVGDKPDMTPMGDEFEDQYTSATADLSAGGVAITTAHGEEPAPEPVSEPPSRWPEATFGPEGSTASIEGVRPRTPPLVEAPLPSTRAHTLARPPLEHEIEKTRPSASKAMEMGAAVAALTLGGAAVGAWLYSRWERAHNRPIDRLRRRFR
jgi:hypothetical protein